MFTIRPRRLAATLGCMTLMLLASAADARAEILFLVSGGTLSVKGYRTSGDLITVTLRGGGEATFDRSVVARIAPDEMPDPEPASAPAPDAVPPAAAPASLNDRPFAEMIDAVSERHGVNPALVHAVVLAESNYEPRARSHKGARGLMQVMPSTAAGLGVRNLYDPQGNLDAGVRYLKGLLDQFDLRQAIAAYNAGPAAVRRYGGVPPFAETRSYVERVLANFRR